MKHLTNKKRTKILLPIMIALLFAGLIWSINIGYTPMTIDRIVATIFGFGDTKESFIIWELRIPRTIVAIFVGMCLAVSGAVMQGVTRNPLATPSMIGVSSGASFGILIVVFMFDKGFPMLVPYPIAAVIGGFLVFGLVYGLATKHNLSPTKLILNGIAVNSCIGAVSLLLTIKLSDDAYLMLTLSQAGNLTYATWKMIFIGLAIALPCIIYVFYSTFCLNILNLDDDMAIGLGLDLKKERRKLLYITILLTSAAVYVAGSIGFVGLIAPHIAKRIVGSNFKLFLPVSMCFGAGLVMLADIVAKLLVNDINSALYVPVGITISILGAPYLLYLLFTQDR
ncbi:MAG: iron ABC transporter permease [Lachnospiraceae bacterium]